MQHNTRRRQGRPKTRWTDDIYNYIRRTTQDPTITANTNTDDGTDDNNTTNIAVDAKTILQCAEDKEAWMAMEEGFVKRTRS